MSEVDNQDKVFNLYKMLVPILDSDWSIGSMHNLLPHSVKQVSSLPVLVFCMSFTIFWGVLLQIT